MYRYLLRESNRTHKYTVWAKCSSFTLAGHTYTWSNNWALQDCRCQLLLHDIYSGISLVAMGTRVC